MKGGDFLDKDLKEYFDITISVRKHRVNKKNNDVEVSNISFHNSYILTEKDVRNSIDTCLKWVDNVVLKNRGYELCEKELY